MASTGNPIGTNFRIVGGTCSTGLVLPGTGDSCTVTVQFTPSAGSSGNLADSVAVFNATLATAVTAAVTGQAAATGPVSTLSATTASFTAKAGTTSPVQTFVVSNPAGDPYNLKIRRAVATVTGNFVIDNSGLSDVCHARQLLGPGQSCNIGVAYSPGAAETPGTVDHGVLTIKDNGSNPETAALTGTVVTPTSVVTPSTLPTFDAAPGFTSAAELVTVFNDPTDTVPLNFSGSGTFSGPNANRFAVDNSGVIMPCVNGTSLAPGGTGCLIGIVYQPGPHEASGTIDHATFTVADDGQLETVQVIGQVALVTTQLTPASNDFGTQSAGTISPVTVFTESNTSLDPLGFERISTITTSGSFVVNNSAVSSPCSNGMTLAPGAFCHIGVQFAPGAAETGGTVDMGTLTVNSNAQNDPETSNLTGTVGATTTPTSVLSRTSLSYNVAPGSSRTKYVIVSNSTSSTVNLGFNPTVGTISGPNAGKFSVNQSSAPSGFTACTSSTSLAPGASCSIGVKYTPGAGATPGDTHTATLTVNDNGSNLETVDLNGTVAGTPPPPVINSTVSPASTSCPTTAVGVTVVCTTTETVTNLGTSTGDLTFSAGVVSSSNPDFTQGVSLGACTAATVLHPGQSCTIVMKFTPAAGQGGTTQTGTVTVLDNDTTAQPTFGISGDVSPPPIVSTVSPTFLGCPINTPGHTKTCGTVTVTNDASSTGSLTFVSASLISSTNPDFILGTGGTCSTSTSLLPGESCTLVIRFHAGTGQAGTTQTGTITVLDNGSQPTVNLSGQVIL